MSQTERILYLDRMMRMNGRVTISQVKDKFEVSERQVKRDIEYMRDRFEAPVVYSRSLPGYHYEKPFKDLEFADQHLVLLNVILKSLTENQQYLPFSSDELFTSLQRSIPQEYQNMSSCFSYQMPQMSFIKPEHFLAICESVRSRNRLSIVYRDLSNNVTERHVEPERIINYGGSWYMLCFDGKSGSLRMFNVSRLEKTELTDVKFDSHTAGYPNVRFKSYKDEVEHMISDTYGIFMGGEAQMVSVEFYGRAKRIVESQEWHPKQKITVGKGDEPTMLTFPAGSFVEVLGKILSFGALAKPVAPPELVQLWKDEIQKMKSL